MMLLPGVLELLDSVQLSATVASLPSFEIIIPFIAAMLLYSTMSWVLLDGSKPAGVRARAPATVASRTNDGEYIMTDMIAGNSVGVQ